MAALNPSMPSPHTRPDLLHAFEQQATESAAYWSAFDTEAFFRPIGTSWSPADTVRHLTKSTRPVITALKAPKLLLRFRFGKSGRGSVTYDELCERYRGLLAAGGQAGRFAPSAHTESDAAAWRRKILSAYDGVQLELRDGMGRWPEKKLDQLQLPHPLLGNLTVREMLFFTLYHQRHHIGVVERHLREG
jgi:DinB family protein